MKKYYKSKILWLSVVLILIDVVPIISEWNLSTMRQTDWISSGIVILLIIARTWFTTKPIKTRKAIREKQNKIRL